MIGFLKLMRSDTTAEILRDPKAFTLLAGIAYRARWKKGLSVHDLQQGQALVGDHRSFGLSQKEYRTAKARLERYGLAAFQGTNKGTVATLLTTDVFDIFGDSRGEPQDNPKANQGPSAGEPRASNVEGKTEKISPPVVGEFLPFIARFRAIRPEFASALDFHVADAIRACPSGTARDQAFTEFERDALTMLRCPPNPVKMLRGYMAQAAEGPKKKRKMNTHEHRGEYPENERPLPHL